MANEQGVSLSWTDYDGELHETDKIDWGTLKSNGYQFQIGDYFSAADTELFDANNNPVFNFSISMSVAAEATTADIIQAINNTHMSNNASVDMNGRFEDNSGNAVSKPDVGVGASINYAAAYAARDNADTVVGETGYDFNNGSDAFIEPIALAANGSNIENIPAANTTDVSVAKNNTDTWSFKFNMESIGEVTATSSYIHYYSYDQDSEDYKLWWDYNYRHQKSMITKSSDELGGGTLGSVMAALTGDNTTATPGLLNKNEGGFSDRGGYISLNFDLTATNAFAYAGTNSSTDVGALYLFIDVDNTDTEQTILDKINNALNPNTILDLYVTKSAANSSEQTVWKSNAFHVQVDRNTYRIDTFYDNIHMNIHAGATTKDKIYMNYKCLRIESLGLEKTNVLSADNATNAINEIAAALQTVNEQRSKFGAYQNRMEHAYAIDMNTAENTQAAEAQIRDTDMAGEMVRYSNLQILQQAGQSMLTQSSQSTQGVLSLIA